MKILNNVSLKKYTTIKIGGIAEKFYIPENEKELIDLMATIKEEKKVFCLLGNGSNLLINDEKEFENVILLKEFNENLRVESNYVYCGASVSIQGLINFINDRGLGGIEYLYSVPGTVGGAVAMNAGRGRKYNQSISDYIDKVEVLIDNRKQILNREECEFSYRNSRFKNSNDVILGVFFQFENRDKKILDNARRERIEYSKDTQDIMYPNFGSVFSISNVRLMRIFKVFSVGYKNGIMYSNKTTNWIVNRGEGNFRQAIKMIELTEKVHKILHQKIEREIVVWK